MRRMYKYIQKAKELIFQDMVLLKKIEKKKKKKKQIIWNLWRFFETYKI